MKKLTVIVVAALVAILVAAAPARAELYPRVPRNWDPDYGGAEPGGQTPPAGWLPGDGIGEPLDTTVQFGDEERVVFNVDSVENGSTQPLETGLLTGLLYDLAVVDIVPVTATTVDLYYHSYGRNPLPGAPANTAGRFELWADSNLETGEGDLNNYFVRGGLAPIDWVEGSGGNPDEFPNIIGGDDHGAATGSGLWLQGTFAELGTTPNTGVPYVKRERLDLDTNQGNLLEMTVVETAGFAFDENYFDTSTVSANLFLPGSATYDGARADQGNWAVHFSDPWLLPINAGVNTIVIGGQEFAVAEGVNNTMHLRGVSSLYAPEPGMASLLGLALLGLLATRRGRKGD